MKHHTKFNPDNPKWLKTPKFASFCAERQNQLLYHPDMAQAINSLTKAGRHRNLIRVFARKEFADEWYEICRESLIQSRLVVATPKVYDDVHPTYSGEQTGLLVDNNEPPAGGSNP